MGHFRNKEEYFQWVKKGRRRLPFKAVLNKLLKDKIESFFQKKVYLEKKFILPLAFILGMIIFFSLQPYRPEKGKNFVPQKAAVSLKPDQASANSAPPPARPTMVQPERAPFSIEDIIPRARKVTVLVKTPQGSGTGFLLPHPGLIVTSAHFMGRSDEAEVFLSSGAIKNASLWKRLPTPVNIAFLKVEGPELDPMPLGDSDQCQEGEEILAVGIPGEEKWRPDFVLTRGRISRCHRSYQSIQYLEIDRALHPANVGGPIINTRGEIIGISRGELGGKGFEGFKFGLAINIVKGLMDQRLSSLEKRLEEKEQFFKYVYDDLWVIVSHEYDLYQKKLYDLHLKGTLSAQEATRLEKRPLQPPAGHSSLKNWVADLSEKVIGGELTKEKAAAQVKAHFEI